ncbi:hypothetical protein BS47DRAFT_1349462, partial [Hydnum rufescens UP504]
MVFDGPNHSHNHHQKDHQVSTPFEARKTCPPSEASWSVFPPPLILRPWMAFSRPVGTGATASSSAGSFGSSLSPVDELSSSSSSSKSSSKSS